MILSLVLFTLQAATAKQVLYAGDLTGWESPAAMTHKGDSWTYSYDLPKDARVEYKYVVDGNWILDPNAPHFDNSFGGENSYWQGQDYKFDTPEFEPKHPMKRTVLSVGGRDITVFTPEHAKNAPILAYGDGNNYESRGKIENVVENLAEEHKIRPAVIVLIEPKDRMQEYWKDSKPYEKFFVEQVLPAVRAATGASSKASDVYVGGSSLGGVISLKLAEDYPDQIAGGIHSQSGAFEVDEPGLISEEALKKLPKGIKVWLDYGKYEQTLTPANQLAIDRLGRLRFKFKSYETPEGHCWTAWRHRMVPGLVYLLGRH